ncbi:MULTISPECIES: hypothetical protein [Bacillus]|uniref:Uncharacterized protein n=1 Tax=Bacillus cereus TaxID=1396 RepID=A0A9X5VB40_BACCE|nr:hypothetical protein [Bacillus cereus]AQQ64328.1 hypothetical Protein FORC21_3533 [Bacillus cereus]MCQ6334328.1 hypothetical protein [Bacillus cereus]OBZ61972.1 hypothetical protein ABH62_15375 [Bacillus cereus]OJS95039.1 hypothetical protein BKK64_14880 [Bacillus cereus]ULX58860.1 hypothetical protein JN158_17615 [Bacillus cereus]
MDMNKYFFCYSTNLQEFLRYEKYIRYICTARHMTSNKQFWLFERTEELNIALAEYRVNSEKLELKRNYLQS